MRQLILSAFSVAMVCTATAQIKEGTITYERKINLHKRLKDEQMKAMLPEFRTNKQELLFSDGVSVYKAVPDEEAPDPFAGGGGPGGPQRMGPPPGMPGQNNILYINFTNQKIIEQAELGEQNYLILDTVKTAAWKLAEETKMVLKYNCKKATLTNSRGQNIVAWYTDEIAIPAGPEMYNGLPGTILLLDVNEGDITFTAQEISNKLNKKDLKEPTKGKITNRAEYNQKMMSMFNNVPGGARIIRIGQ